MANQIKNQLGRIKQMPLDELLEHPDNWRMHPEDQEKAVRTLLGRVGWVDGVLFNKRTGRLIDGHLRVQIARADGESTIPAKIIDISEEDEKLILAGFDSTTAMAVTDSATLDSLVTSLRSAFPASDFPDVDELLDEIQPTINAGGDIPEDFPDPSGADTDYRCPSCGYEWSGAAKAREDS